MGREGAVRYGEDGLPIITNTKILFYLVVLACVLSKLRSVQPSRWDAAIFLMTPGTSCLATIVRSLRDKSHSPIEAPHNYLRAYEVNPGQNGTKLRLV